MDTYADRVEKHKEDAFRSAQKRKEPKLILSPAAEKFAEKLVRLYQNEDFKSYLEFEGMEISERIVNGFEKPPATLFDSSDFGEQMAFNKGRYYQLIHFKAKRDTLVKEYISVMEQERNKKERT